MLGAGLFEELAEQPAPRRAVSSGAPRVQEPQRDEPSWQVVDLDALIAHDHPARLVWSFVTLVRNSRGRRFSVLVSVAQATLLETGMPRLTIMLRTLQPTVASTFWAGRVRARRLRPMTTW
jgi:hypothetical protein